jgi:hypothetical protein
VADTARWLARPKTGALVLVGAVTILVLILVAAYHGSEVSDASQCPAARGLLRRTLADTTGARATFTSSGHATAAQAIALQHDDDDVNNFISAEQTPDSAFNSRALPLADNLGRVVTDLSGQTHATVADLNALDSAAQAAAQYCGVA